MLADGQVVQGHTPPVSAVVNLRLVTQIFALVLRAFAASQIRIDSQVVVEPEVTVHAVHPIPTLLSNGNRAPREQCPHGTATQYIPLEPNNREICGNGTGP